MQATEWTQHTIDKLCEFKQKILLRKINMDFIARRYEKRDILYDRAVKLSHAVTFILSVASQLVGDDARWTLIFTTVTSAISGGLIYLKEILDFDVQTRAKSQTVKYSRLYNRIENEFLKSAANRQREEDFLYWIDREYENLEHEDPELDYDSEQQFGAYLAAQGIVPFENDIERLKALQDGRSRVNSGSGDECETRITDTIRENKERDRIEREEIKKEESVNIAHDTRWAMERLRDINHGTYNAQ